MGRRCKRTVGRNRVLTKLGRVGPSFFVRRSTRSELAYDLIFGGTNKAAAEPRAGQSLLGAGIRRRNTRGYIGRRRTHGNHVFAFRFLSANRAQTFNHGE